MATPVIAPETRICETVSQFCTWATTLVADAHAADVPCSVSPGLIGMAQLYLSAQSHFDVASSFITKSHESWDLAHAKDLSSLRGVVKNIVSTMSTSYAEAIDSLFDARLPNGKLLINEKKIEEGWVFLHSMIRDSIRFIHEQRKMENGVYTRKFFGDVKIKRNVELWQITSWS